MDRFLDLLLLGVIGAFAWGGGAQAAEPASERWLEVFPAYPKARQLCSEHISGTGMHILWESYAVAATPEEVAAFYLRHFPDATAPKPKQLEVRAPKDKILSVYPAAEPSFPRCAKEPGPTEKTVILVSQAIR
jgi:hypothetical protein